MDYRVNKDPNVIIFDARATFLLCIPSLIGATTNCDKIALQYIARMRLFYYETSIVLYHACKVYREGFQITDTAKTAEKSTAVTGVTVVYRCLDYIYDSENSVSKADLNANNFRSKAEKSLRLNLNSYVHTSKGIERTDRVSSMCGIRGIYASCLCTLRMYLAALLVKLTI